MLRLAYSQPRATAQQPGGKAEWQKGREGGRCQRSRHFLNAKFQKGKKRFKETKSL
jgi:hypothetical protein